MQLKAAREAQQQEKDRENAKQEQQKQFLAAQEQAKKDIEAKQGHSVIAPKLEPKPTPGWDIRVNAAEEQRRQFDAKQAAEVEKKTRENFENRHNQLGTDPQAREAARQLMEEKIRAEQERKAAEERARAERTQQMLREQRERELRAR
jgi:hypothetical protein